MKRVCCIAVLLVCHGFLTFPLSAAGDAGDTAGGKDPTLFNRMPDFYIYNFQELEFDRYPFQVGPGVEQAVEGRHMYVDYYAKEGTTLPSALQIIRNYTGAIAGVGGETVYAYEDGGSEYATLKVVKDGIEAWAAIAASGNGMYNIHVVEKQLMRQDVVANAHALADSISTSGRAAVYGIYFDTGKSEIKPESEAAIAEIVKLLKNDPALRLYVVGHTDSVGAFDYNVKLSQARATAVVRSLVDQLGIAAARLTPYGVGPTAPVSSNDNEQGRSRNRRVELVKAPPEVTATGGSGPHLGKWEFTGKDDKGVTWAGALELMALDTSRFDEQKFHSIFNLKLKSETSWRGVEAPCLWNPATRQVIFRTGGTEYVGILSPDGSRLIDGQWTESEKDFATDEVKIKKSGVWSAKFIAP